MNEIELLREKLINSCRSACFGMEFRRVYFDAFEIESATDEDVIRIAGKMGISLSENQRKGDSED